MLAACDRYYRRCASAFINTWADAQRACTEHECPVLVRGPSAAARMRQLLAIGVRSVPVTKPWTRELEAAFLDEVRRQIKRVEIATPRQCSCSAPAHPHASHELARPPGDVQPASHPRGHALDVRQPRGAEAAVDAAPVVLGPAAAGSLPARRPGGWTGP